MNHENKTTRPLINECFLAVVLVLIIVGCRWLIEIPNFKPVMAIALLVGFLFHRKWLGVTTVVSGMLVSDLVIGFYQWQVALAVYVALVLPLIGGLILRRFKGRPLRLATGIAGLAALSAVNFYVLTTIAVWAFTPWYPMTLTGLLSAFAMGLPFLKWSISGNLFFAGLLFGIVGMIHWFNSRELSGRKKLVTVPVRK